MDDTVGRAFYELAARDDRLDRDLDDAERKVKASAKQGANAYEREYQGASQKVTAGFGSVRTALAGIGIAIGLSTVLTFMGGAVAAASDLNETIGKTGVILGKESLPALEKWAEGMAGTFGQSKQQALDAASTFAVFGKSAGLAGEDLSKFSVDLAELGGDLSSFFGGSPEEAIEAIGAALRGESEPIRRYGVLLNEAGLQQRALALGIITTTTQALTPQQRVLAAQAEILAQTADAQGDYARTSGDLAQQGKTLTANLDNLTAEIGEQLLPIMVDLATFANDDLIPALRDAGEVIGEMAHLIGDVGEAWSTVGLNFGDMGDRLHEIADETGNTFDEVKNRIAYYMTEQGMTFTKAANRAETEFRRGSASYDAMATHIEDRPLARLRTLDELKAALEAGAPDVAAGAKTGIEDPIVAAAAEAARKAAEIAAGVPQDLAGQIIGHLSEFDAAKAAIIDAFTGAVTDAKAAAASIAILSMPAIAAGFKKGSSEANATVLEEMDKLLVSLQILQPGAFEAGTAANKALPAGFHANIDAAVAAMGLERDKFAPSLSLAAYARVLGEEGLADYIAGMQSHRADVSATAGGLRLRAAKELSITTEATAGGKAIGDAWVGALDRAIVAGYSPTASYISKMRNMLGGSLPTEGPLKGDAAARGGLAIGASWVGGIREGVLREKASLAALMALPALGRGPDAGAVLGALGGPQLALAGGTGGTGSVINNGGNSVEYHYHLSVDGQPIVTGNARDEIDALRRLTSFGVRGLD